MVQGLIETPSRRVLKGIAMNIMEMLNKNSQPQQQQPQPVPVAAPQTQAQPGSVFDLVGGAKPGFQSVYPVAGVYPLLMVDSVKMVRNRKGIDLFTVELKILQSQVPTRPAGSRMSYQASFAFDATPRNVRSCVAAILGCKFEEVTPAISQVICSASNPANGRLVKLAASDIITKGRGTNFTVCNFEAVPEEIQARAKELAALVGF